MKIIRRKSRVVKIGNIRIGGDHPVAIQSMVKIKTECVDAAVGEIKELQSCGCEIVRLAVKDEADALALKRIKPKVNIPLVADIHFDYRLALKSIESGVDKIRLNPGNIYKKEEVRKVVAAAKIHHIPIRIGVNSGSVKRKNDTVRDMIKSTLDYIKIIEGLKFHDIVLSLKASNVLDTVEAYRKISSVCDYPLHLGVTATGSPFSGAIKSSLALGSLLLEGIGDTLRVSLTAKATDEIKVARDILTGLEMRSFGPEIISCPTCGRCEVDLVSVVKELEDALSAKHNLLKAKPLKIAVMGCVVNGPGEAKEADIGIAFGKGQGLMFKKGKAVRKISYNDCVGELLKEIGG